MEDFSLDRPELTGSFISMEFGPGGRIHQLWVTDPTMPEQTEEFQFVCQPLPMGEETSEDYFPGTILIGARTHPDDPWIVSRNVTATRVDDDGDPSEVVFQYEFNFLDEIRATGRFYEIPGVIPQVAWDLEIVNRSRRSLEIGELGFPLAMNNVLEGFPKTDQGLKDMCYDRVAVHPFVGGAASYVLAQRLNGKSPGLLMFPGDETRWEFFNHVPASLNTAFRWQGIPVVYVHSQAAIEREGWPEWIGGHTSIVLEPGESRTYKMRFAATDRFRGDQVSQTLVTVGRPAVRLFPSAVAPAEVGIAVEVGGATPTRFFSDRDVDLETDADEDGGFCFVKPSEPGDLKLSFEDTLDRESEVHLLFTEPIEELIQKRADWIMQHQVVTDEGSLLGAIVAANLEEGVPILDPETYSVPFGIESSLSDVLFLAEKNTIYPDKSQIEAIDRYLNVFLEDRLLNPTDNALGALLPNPNSVACHFGRASLYPLVFCLYDSLARVAEGYGETKRSAEEYRQKALGVLVGFERHCRLEAANGLGLMSWVYEAVNHPGYRSLAELDHVLEFLDERMANVAKREYPFAGDSVWNSDGFEEALYVSHRSQNGEMWDRALSSALAFRSASPSWWWYGTEKRWSEEPEAPPHPVTIDKGELCLGPSSVGTSTAYLRMLDRDSLNLEETVLRTMFGGLLGVWALVRSDGAASMGFCPDTASKMFGMSWTTGTVGLGLFHYLKGATSYVMPSRSAGVQTFGCHFEMEASQGTENYTIRPWDGIGQRVVVRHLGLEVNVENVSIQEVRFDGRKRFVELALANKSDKLVRANIEVKGLWGSQFDVEGSVIHSDNGAMIAQVDVPAHSTSRVRAKVTQ